MLAHTQQPQAPSSLNVTTHQQTSNPKLFVFREYLLFVSMLFFNVVIHIYLNVNSSHTFHRHLIKKVNNLTVVQP